MPLPPDFVFSQSSLQTFVDCPKRFFLRYIRRLAWPAVAAEPVLESERLMLQGQRFHTLAHQLLVGIPLENLDPLVQDDDLAEWWQNFQADFAAITRQAQALYPEIELRASLSDFSLIARCDLILREADGRLRIYDWKTSQKRTRRERLAARLQTRLYPYLLMRDGARLNDGQPLQPEQVEMVYWFTRYPGQPQTFPYSAVQYQQDESDLAALIQQISGMDDEQFESTDDACQAAYCVYRSFCEQGIRPGQLLESEAEADDLAGWDAEFFEQIAEAAF